MRKVILRTFSKERKKVLEFVEETHGNEKQLLVRTFFEKDGRKIWYPVAKLRYMPGKENVKITDLWTKETWRKRGLASSLVTLLKTLENKEIQVIPHKSHRFYKKLGFEKNRTFSGLFTLPKTKKLKRKIFIR